VQDIRDGGVISRATVSGWVHRDVVGVWLWILNIEPEAQHTQ
jgi:hypothetical protein